MPLRARTPLGDFKGAVRARTSRGDAVHARTSRGDIKGAVRARTSHLLPRGEIKRREVELDLKVNPEEIMSREVELGCESWTSFASGCSPTAVQRTLSL